MICMDVVGDKITCVGDAATAVTITLYGIEHAVTANTDSYKRLGGLILTTGDDDVYVVPSDTTTIVSTIVMCNYTASARTLKLYHIPNGQSKGDNYLIFADVTINPHTTLVWHKGELNVQPDATFVAGDHSTLSNLAYASANHTGFMKDDLSNISASHAINTTLSSDTTNTDDLGESSYCWKDLYISGVVKLYDDDRSNHVDLKATAGSADYTISWNVALPAGTYFITMDTSGNIAYQDPATYVTIAQAETNDSITPVADATYTYDKTTNTTIAITTAKGIITAVSIT